MATTYPKQVNLQAIATLRMKVDQLKATKENISSSYYDPSIEEVVVAMLEIDTIAHDIIESATDVLEGIRSAEDVNLRIG